jgi:hypothetical protein
MLKGQMNINEFCAAHLAFVAAEEDTVAEREALERRDRVLAFFDLDDIAQGIAIAIGMRNILARVRDDITSRVAAAE